MHLFYLLVAKCNRKAPAVLAVISSPCGAASTPS